jgi:hypothetical protein
MFAFCKARFLIWFDNSTTIYFLDLHGLTSLPWGRS